MHHTAVFNISNAWIISYQLMEGEMIELCSITAQRSEIIE